MRLKILALTLLALVLGYVLFWHYMAGEVEDRIEQWVKIQKSKGFSVGYDDLEISGFPYRMELALKSLNVTKKEGKMMPFLFKSPAVTFIAFPWKINHGVIVSDGGDVRIGSRKQPTVNIAFGKTRSSVMLDLVNRNIETASFIFSDVTWNMGKTSKSPSQAKEVKLHLLKPVMTPAVSEIELPVQLKIYMEGTDVIVQEIPVGIFGKKADSIKIDVQLHGKNIPSFSKDSLSQWRDNGGTLAVNNFEVRSGAMDLGLSGELTLDEEMKLLGAFSSIVHGVDHIVKILSGHSAFQMEPGNMILDELTRMSKVEKNGRHQGKQSLELAISLQGGLLFIGPIPVYELSPVVE